MAVYYGPAFGPPKQTFQGPVKPTQNEAVFRSTGKTVSNPAVLGASTAGTSGGGSPQPNAAINNAPQIPTPQEPQIDFDALIAPALAGLDAAVGPLQQGYENNVQSINSAKTNQIASTNANIAGQQNTLGQAKTTQETQARNAQDEARRQFAEIQQGLQARYGGTTGTGAFASELAGRQTLQNIGQTREQLSSAVLAIDQKKQQVEEVGRIALQDIEDRTRDNLNQAKSQLDSALADIRRQKGELQARKAELAANAVQIYQNTVNQVNAQNAAFKQNLYLAQLQAGQKLDSGLQQLQSQTQGFTSSLPGINAIAQSSPVAGAQQAQTGVAGSGGGLTFNSGDQDFFSEYEKSLGLR
jgi:hypothetical protein